MTEAILVEQLSKTYQVPEREGGFGAAVGGFFHRKYTDVNAVQQVSFTIQPGEWNKREMRWWCMVREMG